MLRAIVFDFDGLITDTEALSLQAWRQVYREEGFELSLEEWHDYLLGGSFDPLKHLEHLTVHTERTSQLQQKRDALKTALCSTSCLLPGVDCWLADARRHSLAVGLASSSTRTWVTEHLHRLDIASAFDAVVTREDVKKTKPAPDLYLAVLEQLGVEPHHALALEDSPNGAAAALTAGMHCIVVPNDVTRSLAFPERVHRFASLNAIDLATFCSRIENTQSDFHSRE
jgi:beta-phosphoglucomutase-like phosphatase (HAD superfamily)